MFKRWPFKRTPPAAKVNTTNYANSRNEFDADRGHSATWNDQVHPPQPYCVRNQLTNEGSAQHRHAQMERNPFFYKLSYGLAQKLFARKPYPFSYAYPYDVSANGSVSSEGEVGTPQADNQTQAFSRNPQRRGEQPQVKSNSFPPANNLADPSASPLQPGAIPPVENKITFEIRSDMAELYEQWRQDNMFEIAETAYAKGFGVNSAIIIRTKENGQYHFWVFDSSHIRKVYTKNRVVVGIDIEWPAWPNTEEVGKKTVDKAIQYYEIGKDCVLFTPLPTVNNPLGKSALLSVWQAGCGKDFLRFLHLLYIFKGGIASKYYRFPNTLDAIYQQRVETESKKGFLSEAVSIPFPPGMSPEFIDKMFSHEEVNGNDINWDEANSLFSQDTPFPKSFIEGQVETGALGGSAPEMDKMKEDETVYYYFHYLDKLIHMINETFYDVTDQAYVVVPWQDQSANLSTPNSPDATTPDDSPKEPPQKPQPKEEIQEKTKKTLKFNSITAEGLFEYEAVLLPIDDQVPYEDGHTEAVTLDTVKEYVDDPLSVKEGYIHDEHPDDPATVARDDAIGKYQITGYDHRGMIGKVWFKSKPTKDSLSNFYYSHDRKDGEKIVHANIDFRNVVTTRAPRMKGAKIIKDD